MKYGKDRKLPNTLSRKPESLKLFTFHLPCKCLIIFVAIKNIGPTGMYNSNYFIDDSDNFFFCIGW